MYDPHGPVDNRRDRAEWVEIINVSMNRLDLSDCRISDGSAVSSSLEELVLGPAQYALGARVLCQKKMGS